LKKENVCLRIKLDFIIVPAINQLLDMSKVLYKIKNTSNEIKRWVLLISILSNITIVAQTTLYVETFTTTANDNKGRSVNVTDMSGVTTWTIGDLINGGSGTGTDADWVSGSYFKQTGGVFESFNTDAPNQSNPVSWFSNLVSISGYSNVTVSADLSRNSSNSGSGCEAFYSIDGGAYVSFGTVDYVALQLLSKFVIGALAALHHTDMIMLELPVFHCQNQPQIQHPLQQTQIQIVPKWI
jgi:hypothetical protein